MDVKLIRASVQDAETIWKMQLRAFAPLLEKYQDTDTSPGCEPLDKVIARLEQDFSYYYLIEQGGEIAGAIRVVVPPEGFKRISPIFVLPEHQGKGIAQAAITAAEELHGSSGWELGTIRQEPRNCYLYEKMGYRRLDREMVINDRLTLVFYEKP
ncbi:MAG: GNAT family N-acetyltransferase [Ruminococcaceae bacterium]|nr:GNAT family N-acetyltransferase [Oscillospiraceae bacterium]